MKKVKRISLALTLILGIYSAVAAFLVSGDKLLSMKRSLGRVLALSYRYTALTAAGVGLLTLALFLGGRSRKKRREKKAARYGEERPVEQEPAAWQAEKEPLEEEPMACQNEGSPVVKEAAVPLADAVPEKKKFCRFCGKEISRTAKFCPHCGNPVRRQ